MTSYVLMLQARYRSFIELDNFVSLVHLIYKRTIQPSFDYACTVWCHAKQGNISKLQWAKKYAARIVTGNFDYVNFGSADLLYELNWASFKERCDYCTSIMMFKAMNGLTPPYLTDSIVRANEAHDRNTRLANSYDVHVPSHNSEILKRSFVYKGSVLWNSIHHEVKLADNVNAFKRMYEDMLFPSQQSGNTQFGSKSMTLENNRAPPLYYIKLYASFQSHQ